MQMGFVFILKMYQDKCNCDCNCDYFQCYRNRFLISYIVILFICNRNQAGGK